MAWATRELWHFALIKNAPTTRNGLSNDISLIDLEKHQIGRAIGY